MISTRQKLARLRALGKLRARICISGYRTLADYPGSVPATHFVSPYTLGAKNVDSSIFVLLQDWAADEYLSKRPSSSLLRLGRDPAFPTNVRLQQLLLEHFVISIEHTFATNLFPYIKHGKTDRRLPRGDLVAAARLFALPQIDIVKPRLVICLGLDTFNALEEALGRKRAATTNEAIARPFRHGDSVVWWG